MEKRMRAWKVLLLTGMCCVGFAGYRIVSQQRADHTPPEITVPTEELQISVRADQKALLDEVTAWDDRDGDVTADLVVEGISAVDGDQRAEVTYAAFDQAGNVAKCRRTLHYTDYHAPRFTLSQPLVFRSGRSFDVFDYVGAEDMIDGSLNDRIKATLVAGEISISEVGVHMVKFRVTNSMGDTAYLTVPVEVYAAADYNAALELTEPLVYLQTGDTFKAEDYLRALKTSTEEIILDGTPEGVEVEIDSDVNPQEPGCYSVSYTVSSETWTGHTRLIVVVEE